MNRRFSRIVVSSVGGAMLFGFAGVGAGTAEASAQGPISLAIHPSAETNPPGPCLPEEIGKTKVGPDGETYKCLPVGADQAK
jgi:hypothetical protein